MDRGENLPRQGTAREYQIYNILSALVDGMQSSDDNHIPLKKQLLNMQVIC